MLEYRFAFSQIRLKGALQNICERCVLSKVNLYHCDLLPVHDNNEGATTPLQKPDKENWQDVIQVQYKKITNKCFITQ